MKNNRRSGFTMVELLVVFMVMTVLTGVSVPPIQAYYQNTSYKDVQNRAETVFYAAQQTITSMALSSQIEPFFQRVRDLELKSNVDNVLFEYLELTDDSAQDNRYYAILYNRSDLSNPSEEGQLVLDLLQNLITEKDLLNASIAIEVDSHTRTIQTVFYSLEDTTFTYGLGVGEGILLTSKNRSDETLKQLNLGMAEASVSVKVLALKTDILQEPFIATDINLVNPESSFVDDGNDDGDDDGDDDEWWEDDPTEEDDPPGDGGDPWVITDPTITPQNPFFVYLKLQDFVHVRSLKIHWWSPSGSTSTIYKYKLYYRQQSNGSWKEVKNTDKKMSYFQESGVSLQSLSKKTMELRVDILTNNNPNYKYGVYEFTVYTQEQSDKTIIAPIVVTFANRN